MRYVLGLVAILVLAVGCQSTPKKNGKTAETKTTKEAVKHVEKSAEKHAEKAASDNASEVECSKGSDVRKLVVAATSNGGCEVQYTKQGSTSTVASAVNGSAHCDSVAGKIKNNLASAGYNCK